MLNVLRKADYFVIIDISFTFKVMWNGIAFKFETYTCSNTVTLVHVAFRNDLQPLWKYFT